MAVWLTTPRPGEAIDDATNVMTYWPPAEVRQMFRKALAKCGCAEPVARELIDLGKGGRLARLRQACDAAGVRPVLLARIEAVELVDETDMPTLWLWIFACFTATAQEIEAAESARKVKRAQQRAVIAIDQQEAVQTPRPPVGAGRAVA